jgi:hypothetical protein
LSFNFKNKYPFGVCIGFVISPTLIIDILFFIFFDNLVLFIHPISPPYFEVSDLLYLFAAISNPNFSIYFNISFFFKFIYF